MVFKLIKFFIFTVVLLTIITIAKFYFFLKTPYDNLNREVLLEIQKGDTFNEVIYKLKSYRLIKSKFLFKIYIHFQRGAYLLKSGEYKLNSSMTPIEIFNILVEGRIFLRKVTIPEGYNIYQIAELLAKEGLFVKEEFLNFVTDPKVIRDFGLEGVSLEGYLYPSTYFYSKGISLKEFVTMLVNEFRKNFSKDLEQQAKELGFTRHQIVILASIIEKETGFGEERDKISAVFHNRLKKRMRLESDPTVIYGIWEEFKGNLKKEHLQKLTPYNTYRIFGLPLGPICNPGIKAIKAALYPAKEDYLFFVSMNDGKHIFTNNYKEHLKAVEKYQKDKSNREGKSWRDLYLKK